MPRTTALRYRFARTVKKGREKKIRRVLEWIGLQQVSTLSEIAAQDLRITVTATSQPQYLSDDLQATATRQGMFLLAICTGLRKRLC